MSKNKKKRGLSSINLSARTKVVIAAVVAVLIVLGIVTTVLIVLANKTKPVDDAPKGPLTAEQKRQAQEQQAKDLLAVIVTAQSAMERGDSAKVASIYENELKQTTDTTRKIRLLVDESRVFAYGGKYDKAIKAAKDAEALSSDKYLAAEQLANVYELSKQYALAAQYYTLAGQSVGSENNLGGFSKAYYDKKAEVARAQAGNSR